MDPNPSIDPSASAAQAAGPSGLRHFFDGIYSFISDVYSSLAANGALKSILLSIAFIVAAGLALVIALQLNKRLVRRIDRGGGPGELRLRSWRIATAEEARAGVLGALAFFRVLLITAILGAAVYGLLLVLLPSSVGKALVLVRGTWLTLATMLAWISLLRAFRRLRLSIMAAIESSEHKVKAIKYGSFTIISAPMIERGLILGMRILGWLLLILSFAFVFVLVLSYFSFTWSWSHSILSFFSAVVNPILATIVGYAPKLLLVIVIAAIAQAVLKLLKAFFAEIEAGRLRFPRFDKDWAPTTYKILRLVILILAIVMVFPYIPGSGSEAFRSVAIFMGVLLSLGSSSFVGNMMAGISLTYMNPFRLGDRVRIGDTTGDVIERTLLVTRMRTIKNVVVTIPNSMVLSREVENFSTKLPQGPLILHTSVTIGYDVPWKEVHAALLGAASDVDGLLVEPSPFVLQLALDDYSVRYELNASTDNPWMMATIYSDLHRSIQDSFAKAGIEILTPAYSSLRDGSASTIPGKKG